MPRTVKTAEARKLEIVQTSERMFRENGYANTSVNAIIGKLESPKELFTITSSQRKRSLRRSLTIHSIRLWKWRSKWLTNHQWMQ